MVLTSVISSTKAEVMTCLDSFTQFHSVWDEDKEKAVAVSTLLQKRYSFKGAVLFISLIMTVTRSHSLWDLRNYFKWQNHIFVSNKDVFQALFLLKKVKAPHLWLVSAITPFSLKSLVEWWPQTLFPAKMMLFHARALLSIEKISFS